MRSVAPSSASPPASWGRCAAGQGISIALLGAIAASYLGSLGGRVIFLHEGAAPAAAHDFAAGYHLAMLVGAGLAVAGATASSSRGRATLAADHAASV